MSKILQFVKCSIYLLKGYKNLSLSAKETYLILKSFDWGRKKPYPGLTTIALIKGSSSQTALKTIRELEKVSLITTKRRGLGRTNQYTLLEPKQDDTFVAIEAKLSAIKALRKAQRQGKQ